MNSLFFGAGNFSPELIDAAVAIKLPPAFVKATEDLFSTVQSTVHKICCDSAVYQKIWNKADVDTLVFEVVSRELMRQPHLRFWFELCGDQRKFSLTVDQQALSAITPADWWTLSTEFVPPAFQPQKHSPGLIHIGHAGVFINEQVKILVDPVFFEADEHHVIESINMASIGDISAVFFTHYHSDHFDLSTLAQIPRHLPLFVPKSLGRPLEPDMRYLLHRFGFTQVTEVTVGQRIALSDQAFVDILPFFGEGREIVSFEAFCPLYNGKNKRVLFHADSGPNCRGESLLTSSALDTALLDGPIDTVFGTWWQEKRFLFELSPLTLLSSNLNSTDWLTVTENCYCSVEYVLALAKKIGAKRFVTYAERGSDIFNEPIRQNAYIPLTSLFWQKRSEYVTILMNAGITMLEATPRADF